VIGWEAYFRRKIDRQRQQAEELDQESRAHGVATRSVRDLRGVW
jgi:hypothetical protein